MFCLTLVLILLQDQTEPELEKETNNNIRKEYVEIGKTGYNFDSTMDSGITSGDYTLGDMTNEEQPQKTDFNSGQNVVLQVRLQCYLFMFQ